MLYAAETPLDLACLHLRPAARLARAVDTEEGAGRIAVVIRLRRHALHFGAIGADGGMAKGIAERERLRAAGRQSLQIDAARGRPGVE